MQQRRWIMRIAIASLLLLSLGSPAFSWDPATPDDPDAYGGFVQERAQYDHDVTPGPGNAVGDTRSGLAKNSTYRGLAPTVKFIRELVGSTPNPPGGK
jgi:hypothetical protein